MSRRAYPHYRPSCVEWLGDVPEQWEIKALKRTFTTLNGATPKSGNPEYWDGDIPWATPDDLGNLRGSTLDVTSRMITQEGYASCGVTLAAEGSLVLSTRAPIGHLVIAGVRLCTNQGCRSLVFRGDDDRRFFFYQLFAARPKLQSLGQGSTFTELSRDCLTSTYLVSPPLDEQRAIAAFLDRETARIDGLIEKKQRQIELLQEKRSALISHAVTKGLDPNAKMKDSGIEWLGDVPKHWEVIAIKRITIVPVTDGPHETPELLDEGIPFISAEAIKNDRIDFAKMRGFISPEDHARFSKKYKPLKGDIYLIKSGATTGNVAFVDTDDEFNIWSPLAAIRPDPKKAITPFVFFFMKSKNFFQSIELGWSFGTQQNIGMNVIENIPIALPSIEEQRAIAAFLDRETARIDALDEMINHSIETLREYRTALISAAVTGKIDVRGEVA
ncbi:MAG: restriction endonuclease subunit S [PVC group bacterium]